MLKQAGARWLLVLVHLFWLLLACTGACPLPGSLWVSPGASPIRLSPPLVFILTLCPMGTGSRHIQMYFFGGEAPIRHEVLGRASLRVHRCRPQRAALLFEGHVGADPLFSCPYRILSHPQTPSGPTPGMRVSATPQLLASRTAGEGLARGGSQNAVLGSKALGGQSWGGRSAITRAQRDTA